MDLLKQVGVQNNNNGATELFERVNRTKSKLNIVHSNIQNCIDDTKNKVAIAA